MNRRALAELESDDSSLPVASRFLSIPLGERIGPNHGKREALE